VKTAVRRCRLAIATLAVANVLFFWPLLLHHRVYSDHDLVSATFPWRGMGGVSEPRNKQLSDPATSGETVLVGLKRRFPEGLLWNRSNASGTPGAVNFFQGFLSPFVWLPTMLLPESLIVSGILFLKLNAGFLLAYLFLRRRKFTDLAAACGAATWAWTTGQTVWWLWMQTSVSIFYPAVLLAVDSALETERTDRAIATALAAFLAFLSGGFPHWILYGAVAGGLYLAARLVERRGRGAVSATIRLAAASAIALSVFLPATLVSFRYLAETGHEQERAGIGSVDGFPLRQIRMYAFPDYYGDPWHDDYRGVGWIAGDNYVETSAGIGPFALALALVGLASRKRRGLVGFSVLLGLAMGLPLYLHGRLLALAGSLPGFSSAYFERAKILILLGLALLAACGAELLEVVAGRSALRRALARALPFAIAVPLIVLAVEFYPLLTPKEAVFAETPGIAKLESLRSRAPARFAATGWTLYPDTAEAYGLEDIRGHLLHEEAYRTLLRAVDPTVYGTYGTFLILHPEAFDPNSPVLDLLNVTAIAAPPGVSRPDGPEAASEDPGWLWPGARRFERSPEASPLPKIYDGNDLSIFARPTAFPRFFLVGRVAPGGARDAATATRATLRSTAFVPPVEAASLARSLGRSAGAGQVSVHRYEAARFTLEVTAEAPCLLVSSQKLFPPYWRAFVDRIPARAVRVDGLFFGVAVPAGRHEVEGRFMIPLREKLLSLLGATAGLIVMLAALRRRPGARDH
jgi:hypothetical protein